MLEMFEMFEMLEMAEMLGYGWNAWNGWNGKKSLTFSVFKKYFLVWANHRANGVFAPPPSPRISKFVMQVLLIRPSLTKKPPKLNPVGVDGTAYAVVY